MTFDEHLNDRQAFELALLRVRGRATEQGRTLTHQEALKEATEELKAENQRLRSGVPPWKDEEDY